MSATSGKDGATLRLGIESDLPAELVVGHGNLVPIHGWCFHPQLPIRRLELLLEGVAQPLLAHGMPRPDVRHRINGSQAASANAYRSGFWGLLKVAETDSRREVQVGLRAVLQGGDTAEAAAGQLRLLPGEQKRWRRPGSAAPQVAICMATYNPPARLFERQIESIRSQTYGNWLCLISDDASDPQSLELIERRVGDDPRFRVESHPERLGYYRNFERALSSVPAEAELVALSDQDDQWHADKLATLVERISGEVTLAYSDARVVDPDGTTLSPTFWTERANNSDDLGALLLVNSVTGGAALFRSDLLPYVLPFPVPLRTGLHDHWIATVAMSLGEIDYVDRPLYDYVQHGDAALGHESLRRPRRGRKGLAKLQALRSRSEFREIAAMRLMWARRGYPVVLEVEASATLLLMRAATRITPGKRRLLRRYTRLERSPVTWLQLMVKAQAGHAKTLGSERFLVAGSLWRAVVGAVKRLGLTRPASREATASWLVPAFSPSEAAPTEEPQRSGLQ